jgi:GTPase SAR1 family protein
MNAIIITGKQDAGKSTLINSICQSLNPKNIREVTIDKYDSLKGSFNESSIHVIFNNAYLLELNNKFILVLAGCPTELNVCISSYIKICILNGLEISFIIVAKRTFERKSGFDTKTELKINGFEFYEEFITKILRENFKKTDIWVNRRNRLVNMVFENLK